MAISFSPSGIGTHQRGAGMAGFLVVLVPVLTLGLGGAEMAHWMGLRQTLGLALVEAARVGATRQAQPEAIARAFEHGLRMVYPDPLALRRALLVRRQALPVPWQIRILQPTPDSFLDHADPDAVGPRQYPAQALIRNDYQALQQARREAQGWAQGRGPRSHTTIREANTLSMVLTWPQRPFVPGTGRLVQALAAFSQDPLRRRILQAGYLPFERHVSLAMHSSPAAWAPLADGRVVYANAPADASATPGTAPGSGLPPVTGLPAAPLPPADEPWAPGPGLPADGHAEPGAASGTPSETLGDTSEAPPFGADMEGDICTPAP
ncbi:hypothetical protein [Castellaniella caeni]|uniref:hypothetical protein n=1 Tax=Castellaniella caeni TaxID=266123 RepID=UPI000C9FADF1|nr:hypothetical protein [Castellaniella caeni]